MSHDLQEPLHDPLHDLVADVAGYVDADARGAWVAGGRRRTRQRVGGAVAGVLVLLVVASAVFAVPPRTALTLASPDRGSVDGHPTRIDYPYWSPDLSARPGPQAGLVQRVGPSADHGHGWYAVSPSGSLRRIPGQALADYFPALSPDGRRLGWLTADGYVIRDLVTGEETRLPQFGGATLPEIRSHAYWLPLQVPSVWSADGNRLFVPGGPSSLGAYGTVVDRSGRLHDIVRPPGASHVIGWTPHGALAWIGWDRGRHGVVRDATYVETSVSGEVLRRVTLRRPGRLGDLDQWSASVSPDGRRLAVVERADDNGARVHEFAATTGEPIGTSGWVPDVSGVCALSWGDGRVALPTYTGDVSSDHQGRALVSASGRTLVVADPRLGFHCSAWASDALSGDAHRGVNGLVFGSGTSWLSWHWRELGLATAAVGLAAGALLVVRRRRRPGLSG